MKRTCGTCLFWEQQSGNVGFCHGAPPTVTSVSAQTQGPGGWTISSHSPLLGPDARCGRHTFRKGLKALWLRITGWRT
jgi:hypothetical protein